MSPPPESPQLDILRLYGELVSRHDSLAGALTLAVGPACTATGLAAAVSIANGTSLLIDPDASAVKAAFRSGGIDFVVTTLDEALRVLKNEIRKRKPLSVALPADPQPVLIEMRDRGVQPDLEFSTAPSGLALHHFSALLGPLTEHAQTWLLERHWSPAWLPTATTTALRTLDATLLTHLADPLRRQWLTRIANYQRPSADSGRALWLTPAELEMLSSPPVLP